MLGKALTPGDTKAAPAVAGSAASGLSSLKPSQTAEEQTGILPEGLTATFLIPFPKMGPSYTALH